MPYKMINYRKAGAKDIANLIEIRMEFLSEAYDGDLDEKTIQSLKRASKEYFTQEISSGSFIAWLAEDNGKIIATSGVCFYSVPPNKSCPNGKVAYVQNMYTKTNYRRKGIGKNLFEKMIREAKQYGCTKILLYATDMGRPLYEKFSFTDIKGDMQLKI